MCELYIGMAQGVLLSLKGTTILLPRISHMVYVAHVCMYAFMQLFIYVRLVYHDTNIFSLPHGPCSLYATACMLFFL